MVDWDTGRPNARWQLLKLIHDNFGPGDTLVSTQVELTSKQPYVYAQAFLTRNRQRTKRAIHRLHFKGGGHDFGLFFDR